MVSQIIRRLRAATPLLDVRFSSCPCLELAWGTESLPLPLAGVLSIHNCILAVDSFSNGLPYLKELNMFACRSSASLSIGHLTLLESLSLINLPDLCFLEGLPSLHLQGVRFVDVPKLSAECISQVRVQKLLHLSSTVLLNNLVMAEGFTVPEILSLENCMESSVTFEESTSFSSVKHLRLCNCEMKYLPRNLKCLSSLENLDIYDCPNISSLAMYQVKTGLPV